MIRRSRGISPVIATIIIVSISIAIAVAVAYWSVGLVGIFTRYEEIRIKSAWAAREGEAFEVYMKIRNVGSADATLDDCFINGKPWDVFGATSCTANDQSIGGGAEDTYTVDSGGSAEILIRIPTSEASSGQTLDVKLHSAGGRDYPRAIVLP